MPRLSLTDFVDVVSTSGLPKSTKLSQIKHRETYHPAFDFYKPLRDYIVDIHRLNQSKTALSGILARLTDQKKIDAYPSLVNAYRSWWGRKTLTWFDPPSGLYASSGVEVSINPELGLQINGSQHLIKLYFKADSLSKNRVDVITHLMAKTLNGRCPSNTKMAVLDIRNAKLITTTVPIPTLDATLNAELAYIANIWPNI